MNSCLSKRLCSALCICRHTYCTRLPKNKQSSKKADLARFGGLAANFPKLLVRAYRGCPNRHGAYAAVCDALIKYAAFPICMKKAAIFTFQIQWQSRKALSSRFFCTIIHAAFLRCGSGTPSSFHLRCGARKSAHRFRLLTFSAVHL